MNNYDPLMFLILNRILLLFGLRVLSDESIVYLHRIVNYTNPSNSSVHVIRLSKKIEDAFRFVKVDYAEYKEQQFKNIFEFIDFLLVRCPYITVDFIKSLEKEISSTTEKTEIINQLDKFVRYIKMGHVVLRDFNFIPIVLYLNMREKIIRNFFDTEDVDNQFIELKLRHQKDTELINKFSSRKLVNWVPALKEKPLLAGLVSQSFVNYVTENDPKRFPRFLVDHDVTIIKREVLNFYYYIFTNSETYKIYKKEDEDKDVVVT